MALRTPLLRCLTLLPIALHAGAIEAAEPAGAGHETVSVVEFYNAAQAHYFISAAPQEIADLDTGVHAGWQRTGLSFNAYVSGAAPASPVCRFYIPPALGDSHFYSGSPAECAQARARFPGFDFESAAAFYVTLPDPASGACPAGTTAVHRLWNGRVDTNHRYTTDRGVWQHMKDLGWIAEGYGGDGVALCSPEGSSIATIDRKVAGRAVVKARVAGNVVALLEERLTSLLEDGPDRTLGLLQVDGRSVRTYAPPAGWSLLDVAVHPSGDVSVVLTTRKDVRILRLDREGNVRGDQPVLDPLAADDPFLNYAGGVKDDTALQPVLMHDAARLAPLGESLALVLRTGRNAVVAYRLDWDAGGGYRRAWRTLVEPGSSIIGIGLTSGSFDTFGQLVDHVGLQVDADADGTLAVGVVERPFFSFAFEAHATYFGEPIAAHAGVLVSRVAGDDGRRLGSTAIDTIQQAELKGLRATGHGFVAVGRVRSAVLPDGSGWDAFVARIASDGAPGAYRVIDVDRGDVLFDIAALPSGRCLALGTTGYVQNPSGASISEDAQPLLLLLDADGSLLQRMSWPDGPRQDQLRTIASLNGRWLLGGMRNGPGTHSGDGRPELIAADGFLLEPVDLPAE